MPTIIGNSAPWKQVSEARTNELHQMQEDFYETAAIWARVTGETLDDSIYATTKPQLQVHARWTETYQPYNFLASASRNQLIHNSVISHNKTEPSAAFMHATASYSDAIAPDDTEITEAPAENDEKDAQSSADGNPDEAKDLRPLASAEDFMKSFRALQLEAKTNSDAAAAEEPSPQRRLIFKNLPEWTTVSHVLHLVFGSAIERAWSETSGEVNVQFADAGQCNRYLERHPDGIPIKVGEDVTTISIELMDNDDEHPELARRLRADASRVVCLSGLPTSLIGRHDESILGIVSQASWEDKAFEQVLIKNRKDGNLDIFVSFFNLHDGWEFYQDIKEGTYDCICKFEADPCVLAVEYHFFDVYNPMFVAITAALTQ